MWMRIPEATTCRLHFLQDGLQGEQLEALVKQKKASEVSKTSEAFT